MYNETKIETDFSSIAEQSRDLIVSRWGDSLEALILTGSFARGEAFSAQVDGQELYLSDIEFLLVAKPGQLSQLKKAVDAAVVEAALKGQGIEIDVSLGVTSKERMREFRPCIFPVETRKFGKVLFGDPGTLQCIPAYEEHDISRLDGLILLNNRMVEQLNLYAAIQASDKMSPYEIDKGFVQVVNSLLAFEKRYKCLYDEKKNEFVSWAFANQKILAEHRIETAPFVQAFDFLKNKRNSQLSRPEMLGRWKALRAEFQKVWLYEISQFLGYDEVDLAAGIKYIISVPDLITCAHGWGKLVFGNQLRFFRAGDILRNMFLTSPQFLVYQQAAKLYFAEIPGKAEIERVIEKWEKVVK